MQVHRKYSSSQWFLNEKTEKQPCNPARCVNLSEGFQKQNNSEPGYSQWRIRQGNVCPEPGV